MEDDGVTELKDLLVLDIPAGDQDGKEDIGCDADADAAAGKSEDNSSGGGGGGGMLSDLICALVSRDDIGEKEEEAEEESNNNNNNNNNNNLVSEILHQSSSNSHDEDDGNESQLGLIDTIISHLPSPLDDDAAPASDEACILIHSIVHD
ncbi:hypothetical protein ABFX02_12G180600 [Erythranthe guttata]